MLHLTNTQFGVFLFQTIGIDESSFMSHVFRTLGKMLGKVVFGLLFQDIGLIGRNAIPKFRLSLMKVIDGFKIEIFLMPTEHRLPRSNITVRVSDSFDFRFDRVFEDRIEIGEIP